MTTSAILTRLSKIGFKQTNVRKLMVTLFIESQKPISADEVLRSLNKKHITPNKTTVYREIEFLCKHSVIREVDFGEGKKRYELTTNDHHHHAMCTRCLDIQCVELASDVDALERVLSQKINFKTTGHLLEFFGVCAKCK